MVDGLRSSESRHATRSLFEAGGDDADAVAATLRPPATHSSRRASEHLDAWIARAPGTTTFPAELFARTSCPMPAADLQELQRIASPQRASAAELLVRSGVSLRDALASSHEQDLEAFERFIADYLAAAAATPERRALYEDARLAAPALIEARRALEDRREREAIDRELGRLQVEATKAHLVVRPPLAVQQIAVVDELAEPVAKAVSFVADFVPYLGQAKLLLEAGSGRSMMGLGRPLDAEERMVGAAVVVAPFAAKILKAGAGAAARSIAAIAAKTGRSGPEVLRLLQGARAIEREGAVLRDALERTQAGKALTAEQAAALGRARAHMRQLYATGSGLIDNIDIAAEGAYEAIRRNPADVAKVATTMGLPSEVVERVKKHLFLEKHTLSTFPGHRPVVAHFVAEESYAALWTRAERGVISPSERRQLMDLLTHENVEARLKARGLALLEPVDPKLGQRPFRGVSAHDLAAIAERNFEPRLWARVPDGTRKQNLRAMLEAVYEVRGPFGPDVVQKLPVDVRVEYAALLRQRGR